MMRRGRAARRRRGRQPVGDHRALGSGNAAPRSRRRRSPRRCGLGEFETQLDRTLTLTDRKGAAARPLRRRDRARDRRDPGDDPAIPAAERRASGAPGRRAPCNLAAGVGAPVAGSPCDSRPAPPSNGRAECARSSSTPKPPGLDPKQGHRIIELAALEVVDRRPDRTHDRISASTRSAKIDAGATEVHGMTWEDLKGKPRFATSPPSSSTSRASAEWVIHNAPFDVGFPRRRVRAGRAARAAPRSTAG